jgi:tRNA A-37 threonylcarbamoyl transferase component Bud32
MVLKRYNYRKRTSRLKDIFRQSRGRRCLRMACLLEAAGIATARPIAAADRRRWGMVASSYLVMEEIPNGTSLAKWTGSRHKPVKSVARLIAKLHKGGFAHRDLKEGNILLDHQGTAFLVDLDGLRHVGHVVDKRALSDLLRLANSAIGDCRVSRTDCVRFLQIYCRFRRCGDWRTWWRAIARGGSNA